MEPNPGGRKRPEITLIFIALLALSVRLWGLGFGLPHTECRPDETRLVQIVDSPSQNFHPLNFHYPSLFKYLILAASTKYAAALIVLPMLAAHLLSERQGEQPPALLNSRLWLYAAACLACFCLASPYVLIDFPAFIRDISFEAGHLRQGHGGVDLGIGFYYHLRYSLFLGLGWPLFFCGLASLALFSKRNWKKLAILWAFPLVYILLAGRGRTVFLRYALPQDAFYLPFSGFKDISRPGPNILIYQKAIREEAER